MPHSIIKLLVGMAACSGWFLTANAEEPFAITQSGKAVTTIVTPSTADKQRLSLIEELRQCLKEMTGADLPLGKGPDGLWVGTAADFPKEAQELKTQELGPEGFILRSEARRLLILGNTELALQHAVYTFLESQGCRWYFAEPTWTVIPRKPSLTARLDRRERPAYIFRRIWYGGAAQTPKLLKDYETWMKHNLQHNVESPLPPPFQVDTSHSYARHISRDLFAEHPEWFSMNEGKRTPRQLCVTNKAVQDMVIQSALTSFRNDPKLSMVSVDPNDGADYCTCAECRKIGGASDCAFHLANIVADAVRKEFPDKWVGLNAYAEHSEPPREKIHPGVYVAVTTRFRNTELTFEEQVKRIGDLGAKVGVYEYFGMIAWDWDMPGAALAGRSTMLGHLIRRYHKELNVVALDAESSANWGPSGLGYWVAARMMWNPDLKPEDLAQDFYQNAFGKASVPMKRLYERWNSGNWFVIRQGLKPALDDLAEAYKLENDPAIRARLDQVAMYAHWLRLNDDYMETVIHSINSPKPKELVQATRDLVVYTRRLLETGLIHSFILLNYDVWFQNRFSTLKSIGGMEFKDAEAWKTERTDIPKADEVAKNFADDVARYQGVLAVEPEIRTWSNDLVAIKDVLPETVKEWGTVSPSECPTKSGEYAFIAKRGEKVRVNYFPLDDNTAVDARWKLMRVGETKALAAGSVQSKNGERSRCELDIPSDGVFVLNPGQLSEKTALGAEVNLGSRPHAAFGGRYWDYDPRHVIHEEFILWNPTLAQPLYFFVPKGTKRFVIGLDGGREFSKLVVKTPDGRSVLENDKLMQSIPSYKLNGQQAQVLVPSGMDGKIWSLAVESYNCTVELYGVPPYLSRHPGELLVPAEALAAR